MHIELLVEEPSIEAALNNLLPQFLNPDTTYRIINFRGKKNLLSKLPSRLRAYAQWITEDYRIVVLVDEDRENCHDLKEQLETAAREAGLTTKTQSGGHRFQVLNRIVIEELEAWFLGDVNAIGQAYNRIPESLPGWAKFRNPDAVPGGTWESFEGVLKRYGYFKSGYAKL